MGIRQAEWQKVGAEDRLTAWELLQPHWQSGGKALKKKMNRMEDVQRGSAETLEQVVWQDDREAVREETFKQVEIQIQADRWANEQVVTGQYIAAASPDTSPASQQATGSDAARLINTASVWATHSTASSTWRLHWDKKPFNYCLISRGHRRLMVMLEVWLIHTGERW